MRTSYDFTKARRNPYARRLKKQITLRVDEATLSYFRGQSDKTAIPYQTLINLYLRDCATQRREISLEWRPPKK